MSEFNSSKASLQGWEIETHLSNTSVYSSPRGIVLVDNNTQQCMAKIELRENNAVIEFTTTKINIPAGLKIIQFV